MAVVLALVVAVCWGFGNVFQKQGMTVSFPKISLRSVFGQIGTIIKTLLTNWLWMLGTLMMLAGALIYVWAMSMGDVTVVQPILCLTVVVSAVVGVVWLKEKVSILEWTGIGVVLAGVIMVSLVKGGNTSTYPTSVAMVTFYVAVGCLAAAAFLLGKVGISNEFSLALSAGLTFGLANVSVKLVTLEFAANGAGVPLFWDGILVLLVSVPLYLIVVMNVLGSVFYQTAFANGRASIVAAICTIVGNTVPIVAAITILGEKVAPLHGIGIVVVFAGAVILAVGNRASTAAAGG
jgi:uncharacterized membrane protein